MLLLLVGQMVTYMFVKLLQTNYHTFDTSIDDKIPFYPQLIIVYNMFYPVIFMSFYRLFNKDKDTYYKGVIAGIIGYLLSDLIFIAYPTVMIRPDITNIDLDPINSLILHITYYMDTPAINCFPSLHCVFCFQALYSSIACKNVSVRYKVLISLLLLMIVATTVLVKQHYLIDIIAALLIVIVTNIISNLIYKK